jgi:protein-S-isoprenylcysteine O-methyltransferase Ste14
MYSKITGSIEASLAKNVHRVLARSYSVYFILFLAGVVFDIVFQIRIFSNPRIQIIGAIFLALSTLLIFWAQNTSRNLDTNHLTKETFCRGPYCFTRSPTHWGLFILMLGFGIIANALFVVIFTVISFIITKTVFLKKEEEILADKYGAPYREYKQAVRL